MARATFKQGGSGRISDAERLDWLRLMRSDNVGPVTFRDLISEYGDASAALAALPALAARGGRRQYRICTETDAEAELDAVRACGAQFVTLKDEIYPALMRHLEAPPPALYLKGDPALAGAQSIAIVGSRSASAVGVGFARLLATELGASGLVVVSGLARGVDTAAHWGALDSGTVAVVAGGVDVIYPPENGPLYQRIVAEGVVVSESPPGFQPRGQDFPRRNRLISGLSYGVIVVEAARQSGSLITARFALEQNREVFAVPGHPLDPRAAGPNELIRNGATLLRNAADALNVLRPFLHHDLPKGFAEDDANAERIAPPMKQSQPDITDPDRETLLSALSLTPIAVNDLVRITGLSPRVINVILLELILAGKAQNEGLARVALKIY
ncbi:MAG: DNA-processing protein DprA [Hyphomicrobiales bacterium]|nr:DNA-processing protein DprA [Hyphomicrobiales bacterium]